MTTAIIRLLFAIAISPIVPGVVLWIIDALWKGRLSSSFWIHLGAIVGYPSLIVLGLPLCYLFLRRDWLKLWHFLVLGGAAGSLAFFIFAIVIVSLAALSMAGHSPVVTEPALMWRLLDEFVELVGEYGAFAPIFTISGAVAAGCFWAIMRPSFGAWRQWHAKN